MQIVIDIDEKAYALLSALVETNTDTDTIHKAIVKGKVLPKGHGRLIDADAVLSKIENPYERAEVASWLYETIVEADKEGEDDVIHAKRS